MKKGLNINELSVEQKIGLIITGRALNDFDNFEFAMELVKKRALGCIQVLYKSADFEKYCKPLIEAADYPLLVGGDMEGGCGKLKISNNFSLGLNNSAEDVYAFAKATAKQAKKYGYNMIWGPVVDLADMDRPMTVTRCFGSDKNKVAEFATAYMRAFNDCGIVGTAKHYPSAEDSVYDSHMKINHCQTDEKLILEHYTYSYRYMIDKLGEDMTGLMTGHNVFEKIDPEYPTSLSKKMIDTIKDEKFKGLIITDSLAMMGISRMYGKKEALGLAIAAGNDLLLVNQTIPLRDSYNYLLEAYNEGMFTEERLNDAVARVINAQNRTLKEPDTFEVTEEEKAAVERINRNSVCVIAEEGVPTALDKDAKHLFVVLTPNAYDLEFLGDIGEVPSVNWYHPKEIAAFLEKNFPNSTIMYASEFPHWRQVHKACMLAEKGVHDDVVYITFCNIDAYQGTDSLTERMRMLIDCTSYNIAAVVHFGNPYAMEKIVHVPKIVFGQANKSSVESALNVLAGEYEPKGVMPIKLKLK